MEEIKILALERGRGKGKGREDSIQGVESEAFQRGPKEAGKRLKTIEIGNMRGTGDGTVVLLFLHPSKISVGPTSSLSSEPLQSQPPQPPLPFPAPQDSPHPLRVGLQRMLTSPEKRRENGTQLERQRTKEVVRADHRHALHRGITAMSQTATQTNWRSMCYLWMAKLWTQTTHL